MVTEPPELPYTGGIASTPNMVIFALLESGRLSLFFFKGAVVSAPVHGQL